MKTLELNHVAISVEDVERTCDFYANVMQFESFKHKMRENPVFSRLSAGPSKIFSKIKAPSPSEVSSLPGQWRGRS